MRIECPNCGMPFDVPDDQLDEGDRWSCDCGESWEVSAE